MQSLMHSFKIKGRSDIRTIRNLKLSIHRPGFFTSPILPNVGQTYVVPVIRKLKSPAEYGFGQYLTGGTEIPVRLCYPVLESSYNKKSYNEAIERMGGTDNWHSLLWWDTEN